MANTEQKAARAALIKMMQQGLSWKKAVQQLDQPPLKEAAAYQLLHRVKVVGQTALVDRRHGHPIKLRGESLAWLIEFCQSQPDTPSQKLKLLLEENFQLTISVSQINRVRATYQLTYQSGYSPKAKASLKSAIGGSGESKKSQSQSE
jgi:transposase